MCFQENYIFHVMNVFSVNIGLWAIMVESIIETKIYTLCENFFLK